MRIAIVDDEELCRKSIEKCIREYPWKEDIIVAPFSSGEDFVKHDDYDIVFWTLK